MRNRKMVASILVGLLIVSGLPHGIFAKDYEGHWAKPAIERWKNNGVLKGYDDGTFRPQQAISRAELAALIVRVFGITDTTNAKVYEDIMGTEWHAKDIRKISALDIMNDYGTKFEPNKLATREEAVYAIARAYKIGETKEEARFIDRAYIADWAKEEVDGLAESGFVKGKPGNKFAPKDVLTRAEVVTLLDRITAEIINKPGTYSKEIAGNLVVTSKDVILKDSVIKGNLYLAEGIGEGDIELNNITVSGTVFINGGGENSIDIIDCQFDKVVADKGNGKIRIILKGEAKVNRLQLLSGALLEGNFNQVKVNTKQVVKLIKGNIAEMVVEGIQAQIVLEKGTTITKAILNIKTTITGMGEIGEVIVSVSGVVIETKPGKITVTNITISVITGVATNPIPNSTSGSGNSGSNPGSVQEEWKLIWADEFEGGSIDESKWNFDIGNWKLDQAGDNPVLGWGNNEKQYYTKENATVDNGTLKIAAKKEQKVDNRQGTFDYTSAKLTTQGKFAKKYGKIEIKAKLPVGKSLWPAIWMLPENDKYGPWAASGEIDIMEGWGSRPETICGTLHYGGVWPNNTYTGNEYEFEHGNGIDKFHTYAIEWEPGEIRWYVDGLLYSTQNNWNTKGTEGDEKYAFPAPFDQEFYLILNLAVGGIFDGIGDNKEGDPTIFVDGPKTMEIDYVRAYELQGRNYKNPIEPSVEVEVLPTGARAPLTDGNYIYENDYRNGIKNNKEASQSFGDTWNLVHMAQFGAAASAEVVMIGNTPYARVDISNPGNQTYSAQLIQLTTLGKGRQYKLSFDAKAQQPRNMNVKISGGAERGWGTYSDNYNIALTSEIQHFERTFIMMQDTDTAARVEFNMGLDTKSIYLGNVRLEEIPIEDEDFNTPKEPLLLGNHIYNGAFDKGLVDRLTYWNLNTPGGSASMKVPEDTRELNVAITNAGNTKEAITVDQRGLRLTANSDYQLSFDARTAVNRKVTIKVTNEDGQKVYHEQEIDLTQVMQTNTMRFKVDETGTNKGKLVFELGGANGTVYLDNVKLSKTTLDFSDVDMMPLKNGDFGTGDLSSWKTYAIEGGGATFTVNDAQEAVIDVTNRGTQPWNVMLTQEDMKFSKGITYTVALDARSTQARTVGVIIENASYTRYFDEKITLSPDKSTYTFEFKFPVDVIGSLKILAGKVDAQISETQHQVIIDNVICEVKDGKFLVSSVKNGKFESILDPWEAWTGEGGQANVEVTANNELKLEVQNVGSQAYAVQLFQQGIKFEKGKNYQVGFKARVDQTRKMNINIGKALTTDPWFIPYAPMQTVDLETGMKDYTFTFTMNEETYNNGKIVFEAGRVAGGDAATTIYIDDVYLISINDTSEEGPKEPEETDSAIFQIIGDNILSNDAASWLTWADGTGNVELTTSSILKIDIKAVGGGTYNPQAYQEGFSLENGKTYLVRFRARADVARKMIINIGDGLDYDPWFNAYAQSKTVELQIEERDYYYTFTVEKEDLEGEGKLVFELGDIAGGNAATAIYLDAISIQEVAATINVNEITTNTDSILTVGSPWDTWSGEGGVVGTGIILGDTLEIPVEDVGYNSYSVQVFKQEIMLEKGKRYLVGFTAQADAARKMNINIGVGLTDAPWFMPYIPTQTVDLNTVNTEYLYAFTVGNDTTDLAKMVFEMGNIAGGNATATIIIKDIYIKEIKSIDF